MTIKDLLFYIKLYTGCDDVALKRIKPMLEEFKEKQTTTKVETITRYLIKEILHDPKKPTCSIEQFLIAFCDEHSLIPNDLKSKKREKEFVRARRDFALKARECGYTLKEIGRSIKRDHTTIIHYCHHYKI